MIRYNTKRNWGYSTDIKPTDSQIGDRFLELDTYREFVFGEYNKWNVIDSINNLITVGTGGSVDFNSIKDAVDSIHDSSSSNRYVISVGPGNYYEDEIDLTTKPYVSIVGSSIGTTVVYPNLSEQHLFRIGQYNELSFFTINNIGVDYSAIYCDDIGDYAQAHKLSFNDCDTNITVLSSTQDTKFFGEYLDFNGSYSYGVRIIASNGYLAYANMENYYNYPTGIGTTIANSVQGSGAVLSIFIGDGIGNGDTDSTNYQISDYASLNTISTTSDGWGYGVRVLNVGGPSTFDIDSLSIVNSINYDLSVEHPGTFGTYGGSSTHTKINNASDSVYWAFLDTIDGEFEITRKISVTFQDGTHTDMSTLIFQGGTMGLISGGTITVSSGLIVNVSSGFGYLQNSGDSTIYQRVDWGLTPITLTSNSNLYLYFNETGGLFTSGTRPTTVNNIVIGRVVTNSTGVEFIDSSPMNADHTSNRYGNLFRNALGPIYASGSIVTQNTTPFKLNVSSGEYYFSSNEYLPSGGSGFTFTQYYRNGSGGWNTSATTFVNNTQFDNNGTLSGLTASAFTKHTLYIVGNGANEKYFLVLGQNQYSTLVETENALLPTPPTFFSDSVSEVANIYIRQGLSGITQIEDIRPVIGFRAGGVSSSSLHANLLGLSSDDHKQYLLVDGSRSMSGSLNMSGNTITNAGTINGVTIETHASRHKNGGADEIATSTPGASEIPKADTFGKLDGWISNASSSVKGLTRLSVDPLSAATPIAVGINDTRFLKTITGVTNTSGSLIFSNNSGETTSFSGLTLGGLTATTVSATTYQNLPATPFLPLSGGTVTGATSFTGGLTANTISATTFTSSTETIIGRIPTSASGTVSTGSNPFSSYVQGRYVYVVNFGSNSLQIFDVSNPSSPVLVGTVSTGVNPNWVYVQGKYAYIVNRSSNSLQIFDVSNPSLPVLIGSVSTGTNPYGVYVQGRYSYVANYGSGGSLQIFDVSNPSSPVLVGSVSTGSSIVGVYVQGKYAYVTNYGSNTFQIFDVSNPSSPVLVGEVSTGTSPQGIYVQGRYAYVVNYTSNTLQIFDISNPSSPVSVSTISTGSGSNPYSVYVQGRYVYVANTSNTLQIFNVSNPSSPISVGTVSTGTYPQGLYVQGRYVYVVNYGFPNRLQIFDVGGSYIQQLEAGGILTNTLESVGNATIGNDLVVVGGLNVSQSANILGNLSSTNMRVVSGLTATTISATTYQNLPATPFLPLSGGTVTGPVIIKDNTNPLIITTDNYSPGSSGNILYITDITGSTNGKAINSRSNGGGSSGDLILQQGGNGFVGVNKLVGSSLNYNLDVNGSFGATSVSATTYQNLPTDIRVTGGTYSGSTIIFTNNTGGTFSVTGITTSSAFTGGTVTGATSFTGGLTANTISATTYQNLPSTTFTGGTVSGETNFTGGVTANTITPTSIIYDDLDYLLLSSFRSTYNY